ncbi:hypothetical protein APY03_5521 [Variovorax sp. WDL1]|nr:hypothetical protein APY03_5521 [Variovorax sp. WDL1]
MPGQSSYFGGANRSKESVTLDLKHPNARPLPDGQAAGAGVVVQNGFDLACRVPLDEVLA